MDITYSHYEVHKKRKNKLKISKKIDTPKTPYERILIVNRRLLNSMGFSVQKPKHVLARANKEEKQKWRRYTYPNIKKKPIN